MTQLKIPYLEIIPTQSLLFLDEIQVAPEVFAALRWFAEDMPELAIIISYFYIEPLSFEEFLLAQGLNPSL